jgi:cytochrome c
MIKTYMLALACVTAAAQTARADGDVAAGEKVFQRCLSCHAINGKINKAGPYLLGVIGRHVATAEGYRYSAAMTAFGAGGAVWDEPTIDTFLKGPADLVKGTRMMAAPVRKESERADLIAFLKAHR